MQQPSVKVWSDRARQSALLVRKGGTALGASEKPPTTAGLSPKIQARVKEILAEKAGKGKAKGAKEPTAKQVVQDAISRMHTKGIDMDLSIKAGARHSAMDQRHIQAIHDSSVACGAACGDEMDDGDEEASKAIKSIMDDPGYYAQHECGDIMQGCNALQTLCLLIQSELAEGNEEEDTVSGLVKAARLILAFIENELDEVEGYDEEPATVGHEPMKAIAAREDVNPKEGVAEYGDVSFADAKNKKYPIDTPDHIRAAWNYINKEANAAKYDAGEVKQIKAKIVAAWKKKIDDAGPPSAEGKAIDLIHVDGSAIKALEEDGSSIGGYAVLFGDAANPDLERDYYTKSTDFWLDHFGWPRPMTYHHGIDPATREDPVIGHWTKATVDDQGVWLSGQLDKAHKYYKAIKELVARGYLKLSSDSAPQWVLREKQPNGANFVKRWPLISCSPTVTPMEPRMLPVEVKAFLADLGLDAIDEESPEAQDDDAVRADELKAADDERARRLLVELDLLALEETAQ